MKVLWSATGIVHIFEGSSAMQVELTIEAPNLKGYKFDRCHVLQFADWRFLTANITGEGIRMFQTEEAASEEAANHPKPHPKVREVRYCYIRPRSEKPGESGIIC
jgi:hypothetical protein